MPSSLIRDSSLAAPWGSCRETTPTPLRRSGAFLHVSASQALYAWHTPFPKIPSGQALTCKKEARIEELHVDGFPVEFIQPLFEIGQCLTANGGTPSRLDCFAGRRGRARSAGTFYRRPFVWSLTVDDPEIISLIISEQPRTIVSKRRLHILLKHFFGFKEVTIAVNDHWQSFQISSWTMIA